MESAIINVRMPSAVLAWLDSLVEQGIYKSRSEAIRDFVRNYVKEASHEA